LKSLIWLVVQEAILASGCCQGILEPADVKKKKRNTVVIKSQAAQIVNKEKLKQTSIEKIYQNSTCFNTCICFL
jgi:hypothetical protein